MISDSDDDNDDIDGNLFSRKKAPELSSRPHPPPQVKAEVKREVPVGEGRPPSASPVKEKVAKSDGAVKSAKQELKVVVKRVHVSFTKAAPTPPKEEPLGTPPAQPPSAKVKQQDPQPPPPSAATAGKKRPHLEEEEKESSSGEEEEEEDSDSSFDEEPSAQGLDENESDYEGPSSDDEEFKVGQGGGAQLSHCSVCQVRMLCWDRRRRGPQSRQPSPRSSLLQMQRVSCLPQHNVHSVVWWCV